MHVGISSQCLAPFKGGARSSRTAGQGRRSAVVVRAVAVADDTDIGALFRSALATPAAPEKAADVAAAAVAVPAEVVEAPAAAAVSVAPVPGTEILAATPTPTPPPAPSAPTQGMDVVLNNLKYKPPGYGDSPAAEAAKAADAAAAKPLTEGLSDAGAAATKGLADAGDAVGKGLSSAAEGLGDAVGGAAGAVGSVLGGAAESVGDAAGAVTNALGGAAGAVTNVLGGASDAAADAAGIAKAAASAAADQLAESLQGVAGGALGGAQSFVGAAVDEFNTEVSIIKTNIDSLVGGVSGAVGGATSAVSSQVSSQVSGVAEQVSSLLPPEAQQALAAAGSAVGGVTQQLSGLDGTTAAVTTGLGVGLPALLYWRAVYGGYAGNLEPQQAFDILQSEDALLLDVRTEAVRAERGVAELRKGAFGKGAAVPPVQLPTSLSRRVRDPAGVALEIQALEIAALSKVDPQTTKVIVMDGGQGSQAKTVARALREVGVSRPYVLSGGFKAWSAAGLPVRQNSAEYDTNALEVVEDVAETVVATAADKLSALKEPRTAATAAAALGGLGFFALNFHTSLQFLGVLGLELTLVSRAMSYSSLQDALDDVAGLYNGITGLVTLPLRATEALSGSGRQVARQQAAAGDSEA